MIAYYLDKGHPLNPQKGLLDLSYYEKLFHIACAEQMHEEHIDDEIALSPFTKKK